MELMGTYRGFAPTDESELGIGELEVIFTEDTVRYNFATGLEIISDSTPRSELKQLTFEELSASMGVNPEEAPFDPTMLCIHQLGEGPIYLQAVKLPESQENEPHILVLRFFSEEIDDIFGPVTLYTPAQVESGLYDQAIADNEKAVGSPNCIPRLANGGLAPNDTVE